MNFLKYINAIFFVIYVLNINSQGIIIDNDVYSKVSNYEIEPIGFSSFPSSISLRKYTPQVLRQSGGSCAGFAIAYSALSTMHNIKLNITEEFQKSFLSFDPYYLYSLANNYKKGIKNCNTGTNMTYALRTLEHYGCKRRWMNPELNCNKKAKPKHYEMSLPFKIKDFKKFDENILNNKEKLAFNVKSAINSNCPVVIAIKSCESMDPIEEGGSVGNSGLLKIKTSDYKDSYKSCGGHALTIIGYNDYKFGGAYEIMNSWGKNYGDNGYNWIKYSDLPKIIFEAFVMNLFDFNKSFGRSYCSLGDCKNEYGQYLDLNQKFILKEGKYKSGILNGTSIIIYENAGYVFKMKNNQFVGTGYYYSLKQQQLYRINFSLGSSETGSFGFAENEINLEEDEELNEYITKIYDGEIFSESELSDEDLKKIKNRINLDLSNK